jgi:hypothetical protein
MIPKVEASVVFSGFGTLDDFPNRSFDVLNCGSVVLKVQWPELVVPHAHKELPAAQRLQRFEAGHCSFEYHARRCCSCSLHPYFSSYAYRPSV